MPWFNVDDSVYAHPKFMRLSLAATGLWMRAGAWCAQNMTDGWLPDWVLPLAGMAADDLTNLVAQLEEADLWVRGVGGWQFKDWTDWNKTREYHLHERAKTRERVKKHRIKQEEARINRASTMTREQAGNGVTNGVSNAAQPNPTQQPVGTGSDVVQESGGTDRSAIANRERFDKFWSIAIRKTGKGPARKAFTRALTKTSEHHLAGSWIAANRAWSTWPDKTVIPHPATWLNQERWDDDIPQPHQPTTTSKTLAALQHADQMEMNDDTSRLPAPTHPGIATGPASTAG